LGGSAPAALAQQDEVSVRVEEGQSLRDIARQHLGDPDLWTEILRANGLSSITDLQPGIELRIPVTEIAEANRALQGSLDAIQEATQEGARLFAPDQIGQAIELRDQALAQRTAGAWQESARLAADATIAAAEALESALAERDALAEALLSDRQGWVEGRRPEDLLWSDRDPQRDPARRGEGPDPVALYGADHVSRRQPAAAERQFRSGHSAHADRSAQPA
jgi:hypothetical protein